MPHPLGHEWTTQIQDPSTRRCRHCETTEVAAKHAGLHELGCPVRMENTLEDIVKITQGEYDPNDLPKTVELTATINAVCSLKDCFDIADAERQKLMAGPRRRRLPSHRRGYTQKVKIGGEKVFLRTSEYDDGTLGEIFVNMYKQGASFGAMVNAFCVAISVGLQYGVPLEKFVDLFIHSRFPPDGIVTGHDKITGCLSAIDLIFQDLALTYLGDDAVASRPAPHLVDSE